MCHADIIIKFNDILSLTLPKNYASKKNKDTLPTMQPSAVSLYSKQRNEGRRRNSMAEIHTALEPTTSIMQLGSNKVPVVYL